MPDQTNAEVSDERLRELIQRLRNRRFPGKWSDELINDPMSIEAADALQVELNRRSVTSQASEGWTPPKHCGLCIDCDGTGLYPSGQRCGSCFGTGLVDADDGAAIPASPSKRVERLETALREIDNRATLPGGDDTPYRGQDKNLTDLRWIADRARQALAGRS